MHCVLGSYMTLFVLACGTYFIKHVLHFVQGFYFYFLNTKTFFLAYSYYCCYFLFVW